ncbi:FecR domain-containing protein [Bradyrhizobium sp. LHD-71]|uniref:FecR domain-containing protein n=1 Tax=Bradyrhizobium sp. LHD-71 TaxID=3072141 RepID=UPI00280EAD18|nr:FecR domain-containing protein [Bradyrhizobium sp. LHD-71]MDQ8732125.1 FecR domain-containing protein [Bradyrhizobium sp. LHD-71]
MQGIDRRIVLAALAVTGLMPRAAFAQADGVAGKVDEAIGLVTAEGRNRQRPLVPQETVFVGETIATGNASKAGMRLGVETVLRLGELARVRIDRYLVNAGGTIQLNAGPLLLDKPKTSPPVNIRSPFGLISVRGTRLFAGPSRGVFGVFVVNGAVTVRSGGRTVRVEEGFGTDVSRPGAAPTAPTRWGEERIRLALASVS